MALLFQEWEFDTNKEFIFNCYLNACLLDKDNFPNNFFIQYLKRLPISNLEFIADNVLTFHILDITKDVMLQLGIKKIKKKRSNSFNKPTKDASANIPKMHKSMCHVDTQEKHLAIVRKSPYSKLKEDSRRELIKAIDLHPELLKKYNAPRYVKQESQYLDNDCSNINLDYTKELDKQKEKNTSNINLLKFVRKNTGEIQINRRIPLNVLLNYKLIQKEPYQLSVELASKTIEIIKFFSLPFFKTKLTKSMIRELCSEHKERANEFYSLANQLRVRRYYYLIF